MAEPASPLGGRAPVETARIALAEIPHLAKIAVRGRDAGPALVEAMTTALGRPPPLAAGTIARAGVRTVLWLGPGEWRVLGPPGDEAALVAALQAAVPRALAAVVDVSDAYATLRLGGAGARDLLAAGCPLDLHPRRFESGQCARSLLGGLDVLLLATDTGFDIEVRASHAAHLWDWLVVGADAIV